MLRRLSFGLVLIAAVGVHGPAAAQGADRPGAVIEEIVVTATKRGERNLQDLPMSITAFSEDQLEVLGADDMLDYLTLVPGLSFRLTSATGSRDDLRGGRRLALRGIESGPDGIPTTAFYIDDAPMPIMDPKLFDIDRVEVLRGPQGTLFGANSMGGTVRLVTNKPKIDTFEYKADATFGLMHEGEESYLVNGMVNMALVEGQGALRAVAFHRNEGGFVDIVGASTAAAGSNRTRKNVNDEEVSGARLALLWQPVDALTILPSLFYQKVEVDNTPEYEPEVGDLQFFDKRVDEVQENEFTLASLEISYDFGNMQLFSSTSFSDSKLFTVDDFGKFLATFELPPDPFQRGFQDISTERFAQEIRLSFAMGKKIDGLIGFFYLDEERLFLQDLFNDGLQYLLDPSEVLFTGVQTNNDERIAIFGEVTYTPSDAWELTAGLRWFDNDQDQVADFDGFFNGGPSRTEGVSSESEVSPKVQVAFHPNDDVMIYGSGDQGFPAGRADQPGPGRGLRQRFAGIGIGRTALAVRGGHAVELRSRGEIVPGRRPRHRKCNGVLHRLDRCAAGGPPGLRIRLRWQCGCCRKQGRGA